MKNNRFALYMDPDTVTDSQAGVKTYNHFAQHLPANGYAALTDSEYNHSIISLFTFSLLHLLLSDLREPKREDKLIQKFKILPDSI